MQPTQFKILTAAEKLDSCAESNAELIYIWKDIKGHLFISVLLNSKQDKCVSFISDCWLT